MNDEEPTMRVKIEGFRAIGSADLIIDGITLVAGENGCGKSTLSKLLYFLYKTVSNYDLLVSQAAWWELKNICYHLERLFDFTLPRGLSGKRDGIEDDTTREFNEILRSFKSKDQKVLSEEELNKIMLLLEKLEISRLKRIGREFPEIGGNIDEEPDKLFQKFREQIVSTFKEAFGKMQSRPASLFWNGLKKIFNENKPTNFEVYEHKDQIISLNSIELSSSLSVDNTVYIDTPMAIGIERENEYWDDLNELLKTKDKTPLFQENKYSNLSDLISKEIIQGEVSLKNDVLSHKFSFQRADGKTFDLLECATGIKSFSILQILLNNGSLTNRTLLIIDEPESNLHPQWIIEYARVLVLLHKHIGVKIFLASHNPDMVSAIKYISEEQGIQNNVNFYLAEKTNKEYSYNYKHLKQDIEPIFASFNIAIDRINEYGV
ncbi:MAG: AAA family ATPase [Candidatus Melainabacteria bacterium]|jgi:predicted ATP-dependent endonuclease of OLD family